MASGTLILIGIGRNWSLLSGSRVTCDDSLSPIVIIHLSSVSQEIEY